MCEPLGDRVKKGGIKDARWFTIDLLLGVVHLASLDRLADFGYGCFVRKHMSKRMIREAFPLVLSSKPGK